MLEEDPMLVSPGGRKEGREKGGKEGGKGGGKEEVM